jgi:hypothetical protein
LPSSLYALSNKYGGRAPVPKARNLLATIRVQFSDANIRPN